MTVTDEEDRKLYTLSGDTAAIKPGDRVKLLGKKSEGGGFRQVACLGVKSGDQGLRRLPAPSVIGSSDHDRINFKEDRNQEKQ